MTTWPTNTDLDEVDVQPDSNLRERLGHYIDTEQLADGKASNTVDMTQLYMDMIAVMKMTDVDLDLAITRLRQMWPMVKVMRPQ